MGQFCSKEEISKEEIGEITKTITCRKERMPFSQSKKTSGWDLVEPKNNDYWFSDKRFTVIPKDFYENWLLV